MLIGKRPYKHRFSASIINIAVELFRKGLGYRQIESVFNVLEPFIDVKGPSDSTVRLWIMRIGHNKIQKPLPIAKWMGIADVTVDIGTIKCLVNVAVDVDKLEERGDYTLKLNDLEIVGINPTEQANGQFAYESFETALERLGGAKSVMGFVIDQGPDIKKGAKLLQEAHEKVRVFFDLSHKLALVIENDLENDPSWPEYTKELAKTKQRVQQTELAALQPPNQRSKARFMNIRLYLDWPKKVGQSKAAGRLESISQARYEEYFGWLSNYSKKLSIWEQKVRVLEMIKGVIREHGLSYESYDFLLTEISRIPLDVEVNEFVENVFTSVYEEVEKLNEEETIPIFTEILESLFGKYKYHTARGGQGITGNMLTIGALVGDSATSDEICVAMESTPVRAMLSWVKSKVGETLTQIRNRFFNSLKETEFAGKTAGVSA